MSTYGRTEKEFGSGKNIWFQSTQVYPVGGLIDTTGYEVGAVIPAGSMCVLDTASGALKIVKAADIGAAPKTPATDVNGLLYNDVIVGEFTTGTVVHTGVVFEDMLEEAIPAEVKAAPNMSGIKYVKHA